MITVLETINNREFKHISSEFGGKLRCIETEELFNDVYVPSNSILTFEELPNDNQISNEDALKIITGQWQD